MLTWQEKLALAERDVVDNFLKCYTCGCESNCIKRIRDLGDDGIRMVMELRDRRLAGWLHS